MVGNNKEMMSSREIANLLRVYILSGVDGIG
jgi:hypothetical protein